MAFRQMRSQPWTDKAPKAKNATMAPMKRMSSIRALRLRFQHWNRYTRSALAFHTGRYKDGVYTRQQGGGGHNSAADARKR